MTLLFALACSTSSPSPVDRGSGDYTASLGDEPDFTRANSTFTLDWWLEWEAAQLSGSFSDEPMPSLRTEAAREGSCRVMTWEPSHCDACEGWCVDGECVAYPDRYSLGAATWTWPDGSEVVHPDEWHSYLASGEATTMGESSLVFEDLSLTVPTVEPVNLLDGEPFIGRGRGEDVTLEWDNPIVDGRVRVFMTDCAGSHGGIGESEIECEGPDTGRLTIPGSFLDALEDGDWSHGECGSHTLDRYHAAASSDGQVRLESSAPMSFFWFPGW